MHWLLPGALHKARWMSVAIYTNKGVAFQDQLEFDRYSFLNMIKSRESYKNVIIYIFSSAIFIAVTEV